MPDFIDTNSIVFIVLWQTSLWLAIGMAASTALSNRPARAHGVLLLCIAGAMLTPLATLVFKTLDWGFLAPLTTNRQSNAALPIGEALAPTSWDAGRMVLIGLAIAWGVLTSLLLTRLLIGVRGAQHMLRRAEPIDRASHLHAARLAARRLGLSRPPLMLHSDAVACPMIWCWGRRGGDTARILLPDALLASRGRALWSVLCHELAHLKRRDHLSALLVELTTCLLAWHPFMWMAKRRAESLCEEACDEWVLAAGASPATYAEMLLALKPQRCGGIALAAVRRRPALRRRIERILEVTPGQPAVGLRFMFVALLLGLGLTVTTSLAHRRTVIEMSDHSARATLDPVTLASMRDSLGDAARFDGVISLNRELDLGLADPEQITPGTLWLLNNSARPLRITDVKTSCGCTTVEDLTNLVLAPGEARAVNITIAADAEPGKRKTKEVIIIVEGQGPLKIPIHVTVRSAAT